MTTREALRREMEETRLRYHALLAAIPDEALQLPSENPAWTVGEVLYHMSVAPRLMIADVRMITGHSRFFGLIGRLVPRRLFDWLNARLTRFGARNLSRDFLAREYDRAHQTALRALASVSEEDLQMGAQYPGWDPLLAGEVTLEQLFHYVKNHFEVHRAEIGRVVGV